jgi:Copper transport outer membrane protein, MctB
VTSDFRYHVASLAAVFLALGIGILVGTAFVGTTVVRQQTATMNKLSANYAELRKETHEREQTEQTLQAAVPLLVKDILSNQRVWVVQTPSGREAADQAQKALELAGATVERATLPESDESRAKLLKDSNLPPMLVLAGGENEELAQSHDLPLLKALHQASVRVVAVELYENKLSLVATWSTEADATVDCINRATGWLALPIALAGENGNFGLKDDAKTPPLESLVHVAASPPPHPTGTP